MWIAPNLPNGRSGTCDATELIHHNAALVGTCKTSATPAGSTPATSPPVSPHIITGPAAGPANRLAGNDATGNPSKRHTSNGATASCAVDVTAKASTSHRGPGTARATRADHNKIPADAATDS